MEEQGSLVPTAEEQLARLREACPAVFYRPNKPAPEDWIVKNGGTPGTKSKGDNAFFESLARRRINIGGNRAGKTTKLCLEAGSFCVGRRPWYPMDNEWSRKGLKHKVMPAYPGRYDPVTQKSSGPVKEHLSIAPARVRYVIPNFQTHLPEVIKEFEKWWPRDWWDIKARDAQGTAREFRWFNGSWIGFMSHKMNPEDFEGIEADLIVWDEPPPRNIWVALERGIVSTGGRSIIGATLLDASSWFWNEIVIPVLQGNTDPEDIAVTFHSIWDNTAENGGCPEQTVGNVRSWLQSIPDPDERLAREHGIPIYLGGLVLSSANEKECVVEPFELHESAYIVSAIDPAGTRPFAALHVAYVLKKGEWIGYIFDETWIPQTRNDLGEFCRVFTDKEKGETDPYHPTASQIIMIDPFAEEIQKADSFGRSMRRILAEDYGINTQKANRQGKRARLLSLNAAFGAGKYKIFGNCVRFRQEMKRWSWDQKSAKLTSGPDDLCDCLSYIHSLNPSALLSTAEGERHGVWVPEAYRERETREAKFRRKRRERVDQGYEFNEKADWEEEGYRQGGKLVR